VKLELPRYLVRGGLVLLSIAIALAVGYWNIRPTTFVPPVQLADPLQPDFFMINGRITMLGQDGTPIYHLVSERATHLVGDDSTRLEQPNLTYFREGEAEPWTVTAVYGRVTEGGDQVMLQEDVVLQQRLPGQLPRRLTTSAMTIFPPKDYAETDQHVRIEAARHVTTATGMQVYFNDGRLILLSNVRGQHEVR
jgi:lipopolysaccharide export system protein LptC